jgi:acetyl-CoA carboxylase carboxyltransferase component
MAEPDLLTSAGDSASGGSGATDASPADASPADASPADAGERVARLRHTVSDEGRPAAVTRAHDRGRLTPRERIAALCEPGSFHEYGTFAHADDHVTLADSPGDGMLTGTALIDGRPAAVVATDFTVVGGSDGNLGIQKFARVAELALRRGLPLVMLIEGGGHRITEGLDSRTFGHGGVETFEHLARLSGWAPIVCGIMGPGFAGPANYSAFADLVLMVKGRSAMGLAGPALVRAATGEDLDKEQLGGTGVQVAKTGMADLACADDTDVIARIREFLSFLPTNAGLPPPGLPSRPDALGLVPALRDVVPDNRRRAYDMKAAIRLIVDDGTFFELRPQWGKNVITAVARIDGRVIGVAANQPMHLAGALDSNGSEKLARFLTLCSAFGIPVLTLCDTPGFLVGSGSEASGIVRRSAKVIYALAHSQVPLYTIIVRKGYGMGWNAMGGGRAFGNDLLMAWPSAEILAMGIEGAVDVALRRQWEDESDPAAARQTLIDKFLREGRAERAAAAFTIDELIDPAESRARIAMALRNYVGPSVQQMPPKRHGIPPL